MGQVIAVGGGSYPDSLIRIRFSGKSVKSGGLEDRGHALAAADAHGLQQVAAVPAAQLAQAGGEHPGAGGADGVAERDPGSVDVELVRLVPAPAGQHGEHLDRERLVELDQVDVAESQARSGK